MRRYKFVGDEPVEVPALGVVVEPGETVEVEDVAVADGLDGQDTWEHIPDPARSKAAKKAAATRADDGDETLRASSPPVSLRHIAGRSDDARRF